MRSAFPTLQTERLLLRQFDEADLVNVFKGLSDPEVTKYYGISYQSLEDTKRQMRFFAHLEATENGIWWALCSRDHQTFYGAGGFNDLNLIDKKVEIGFWLLPGFWGQGIMTEALPLICTYGFETLKVHRIEAVIETENMPSLKLIHKLGFRYEGTLKNFDTNSGKWVNLDLYAKISSEAPVT